MRSVLNMLERPRSLPPSLGRHYATCRQVKRAMQVLIRCGLSRDWLRCVRQSQSRDRPHTAVTAHSRQFAHAAALHKSCRRVSGGTPPHPARRRAAVACHRPVQRLPRILVLLLPPLYFPLIPRPLTTCFSGLIPQACSDVIPAEEDHRGEGRGANCLPCLRQHV